jgi:ABC-type oligopeptide transport system substrate-binding subunit
MAIDRELLVEKIFAGSKEPAHGVIPPTLQGRDNVCPSWEFDPDMAKETWDAAQAAAPIENLTVWFNAGSDHEVWVEAAVNMWGQYLGIDTSTVAFEAREWADYLELLNNQEVTGPFRLGWGQDYPSPLNFLEPLYASYSSPDLGGYNNAFYANPDFDAALAAGKEKIAASGQLEDGLADYYAAEDILCDDANIMPIRYGINQFVHSEDVSDLYVNSFSRVGYDVIKSQDGTVSQDLKEPESLLTVDNNESEGGQVLTGILYTGLIAFDPTNNEPYNAHAKSVTSDDGGVTWTIELNPGWTFHNGEPVTAQSYVDAWSYGAREELGLRNTSFYVKFAGYDELNGTG